MTTTENPQKMRMFGLFIGLIVILAFGLSWWVFGSGGIAKMITWFFIMCVIAVILFIIVYAVYWLLKIHPIDAVHVNRERIIKSCKANKPDQEIKLFFKGTEEWENKFIGFVTGVCQIKQYTKKDDGTKKSYYEDCISFRRQKGFLSTLFGNDEVVRVLKKERTSLNADIIFLDGMSFTPEKFGFFFLPDRWKDTTIRRDLVEEVHEVTIQEIMKEEVNIVNDAIAISPRHQKDLERTNMQALPVPQGGNK